MQDWLSMGDRVITNTGFPAGLSVPELAAAFEDHTDAVKATIPPDQLLVYEVKQGWQPLCEFLGQPVPEEPFPRTNSRIEFWDRLSGPPPAVPSETAVAEVPPAGPEAAPAVPLPANPGLTGSEDRLLS